MDEETRKQLEAKGWQFGNAEDFLTPSYDSHEKRRDSQILRYLRYAVSVNWAVPPVLVLVAIVRWLDHWMTGPDNMRDIVSAVPALLYLFLLIPLAMLKLRMLDKWQQSEWSKKVRQWRENKFEGECTFDVSLREAPPQWNGWNKDD